MRSLKLVALLGLALAAPSQAQFRPAPLADIYESYNDCFKVATQDGIKPDALAPLGWVRATASSKDGKKLDDPPFLYGHGKRATVIMLSAEKGEGLCMVMARLENSGSFDQFAKAWGGKLPAPDKDGAISFAADGHPVQLRRTGSAGEPSLSIVVMTPVGGK